MKILLVSYYFPPYNTPGSLRNGRTAELLSEFGHDVRVLCAACPTLFGQPVPQDLEFNFPRERIVSTEWTDIGAFAQGIRRKTQGAEDTEIELFEDRRDSFFARFYRSLVYLPDERIGWYSHAVRRGNTLVDEWRPDLIYASGLPMTSIVIGRKLGHQWGIPWFAEFRDLFTDGHYYSKLGWRRWLDGLFEGYILKGSTGLVTVSEPLADQLKNRHDVPVCVVRNGYDPMDFSELESDSGQGQDRLRIFYGGSLYGGLHNPNVLFEALELLGEEASSVDVDFFVGDACANVVRACASQFNLKASLSIHPLVSHKCALEKQEQSDILLLLLANLESTKGVFTTKLFEYFGARRRILILGGTEENVASKVVLERSAGAHPRSAHELAKLLKDWVALKKQDKLERLPESVSDGFTREEQTRKLESFLCEKAELS